MTRVLPASLKGSSALRLALVLWNGSIGGAEMLTAALAREFLNLGIRPTVVFVGHDEPVASLLREAGVQYHTLGFSRGSHLLLHPKRFAGLVGEVGADGAILDSIGYQAAALRLGGYRGRIVCVEHGAILQMCDLSKTKRVGRWCERLLGLYSADLQVAVSDFVHSKMMRRPRADRVVRINNGLDLASYLPSSPSQDRHQYVVGWAGRLIRGKGVGDLIRAVASLAGEMEIKLLIAGDGPERSFLESLADELGIRELVVFCHWTTDMPAFWRNCDVGAFPTNGRIESFGMGAVEAMASGKPVVVSRAGGLPEVVQDGETGIVITPGSVNELACALRRYGVNLDLRNEHGKNARARCEQRFDIRKMAERYAALCQASP